MAEAKTKANDASVEAFLDSIGDDQVRLDCQAIAGIMQQATRAKPVMWGSNIVGFGTRRYKDANGRDADWMLVDDNNRRHLTNSPILTASRRR